MSNAPLFLTIPLALLLAVLAAASAMMARRGAAGTLHRSDRLGVHTPAAMASDESFAMANRVAAPVSAGAAAVAAVMALLVVTLPLSTAGTITIWVLGLAGAMGLLVAAGVLGDRAARQVPVPARKPGSPGGAGCSGCACGGGGCAGITRNKPAAAGGQP
ncbi:MAG: SdpI family protein [Nakamurella sp.]